ncbi:MAG: TRAP transporter substrate-binding protein [Tissierellia bacterium]|jgi:tripartite ATP-independent transporter DctP family solute receptor|nr:TRAP transporter substrate-binding protein [Bacillota bacterium]NLL22869.1 TRAP transporter substrate-binding protein [Tissierellia bacterium]
MKKILALLLSLVMIVSLSGCAQKPATPATQEGEPINIMIGHTDSSSRSTHKWAVWLGEYLEENAPGRFTVEVHSDGALGDSPDLVAGIKLGTITMMFDLSSVVTAATGEASGCIDLPYLYPTYEDWVEGTFEKGGLDLFNELIKDQGYYCIDMYYNGMRHLISSAKHYHNSDDLHGQKVRIAQNELNVEMWKAMGANPTPMAWGEVITSLSQNTINALDHSLGVFNDFSLHEIAPYVTLTNHASSPFPIITSLEWIESLDPADREVLEAGVREMARQQRDEERAKEAEYIERFRSENATVEELTPEEVAAFIESVQPVYDLWRQKVGDEVMDKWLNTRP